MLGVDKGCGGSFWVELYIFVGRISRVVRGVGFSEDSRKVTV